MNSIFSVLRERPIAFLIGYIARLLDYAKSGIDRIKRLVPKEMYTLALLLSYLKWTDGSISRPEKGILKIHTKINDRDTSILLRSHSSDAMTFAEVIMSGEYAPVIELIHKQNRELSSLIIDAGSNIGLSTIFFKSYFPQASIICIEPDLDNITLLQKNIDGNQLADCKVIQAGLWYKDCQLEISHDFRDGEAWSLKVFEQKEGRIRGIGISSLLAACLGQRIGLLKIDIEGSEFEIFRKVETITPLIKQSDFIVAEIHQEFGDVIEIQNILTENCFDTFVVGNLLVGKSHVK